MFLCSEAGGEVNEGAIFAGKRGLSPIIVINVKEVSTRELAWAVGIHLTLVFSGVMFALMDRISGTTHGGGEK